jgi:8-oxo-dGTP diphosphatase
VTEGPAVPEASAALGGVDTRVGCYCVVVEDGRVLLTHWNEHGHSGWSLPGGGMESGESTEQTAVRETREESGLDVAITGLLGVDAMYVSAAERIEPNGDRPLRGLRVVYRADVTGGRLTAEANGSSDAAQWFPLAELPPDRVGLVDLALNMWRANGSD